MKIREGWGGRAVRPETRKEGNGWVPRGGGGGPKTHTQPNPTQPNPPHPTPPLTQKPRTTEIFPLTHIYTSLYTHHPFAILVFVFLPTPTNSSRSPPVSSRRRAPSPPLSLSFSFSPVPPSFPCRWRCWWWRTSGFERLWPTIGWWWSCYCVSSSPTPRHRSLPPSSGASASRGPGHLLDATSSLSRRSASLPDAALPLLSPGAVALPPAALLTTTPSRTPAARLPFASLPPDPRFILSSSLLLFFFLSGDGVRFLTAWSIACQSVISLTEIPRHFNLIAFWEFLGFKLLEALLSVDETFLPSKELFPLHDHFTLPSSSCFTKTFRFHLTKMPPVSKDALFPADLRLPPPFDRVWMVFLPKCPSGAGDITVTWGQTCSRFLLASFPVTCHSCWRVTRKSFFNELTQTPFRGPPLSSAEPRNFERTILSAWKKIAHWSFTLTKGENPGSFPWTGALLFPRRTKLPFVYVWRLSRYVWVFSSCWKSKGCGWVGPGGGLRFVRWSIVSGGWELESAATPVYGVQLYAASIPWASIGWSRMGWNIYFIFSFLGHEITKWGRAVVTWLSVGGYLIAFYFLFFKKRGKKEGVKWRRSGEWGCVRMWESPGKAVITRKGSGDNDRHDGGMLEAWRGLNPIPINLYDWESDGYGVLRRCPMWRGWNRWLFWWVPGEPDGVRWWQSCVYPLRLCPRLFPPVIYHTLPRHSFW